MEKKTYSFSKLGTWDTCPYSFKSQYILKEPQEGNAWGTFGSYAHDIIEKVLKGELKAEETEQYFLDNIPDAAFPKESFRTKWITQVQDFFRTFTGINDEVIGVERKFNIDMGDYFLRGFIDLETRDKNDGFIKNIDWKTSSMSGFSGKKLKEKARQLYLYSLSTKEKFGEFPKELYFYMIKDKKPIKIEFKQEELDEAVNWANEKVKEIESAEHYVQKENFFFCRNLCGSPSCEFSSHYLPELHE